ncbi:MAG: hypothetical protein PWP59_1818, partial [Sphaerochaeta sp.]|nr:hypothetical protein [Sphaerochaeta sp.]
MDRQDRTDIEIQKYCDIIRNLLLQRAYDECERRIMRMMERFPHLPEPHNLYGILLEKRGEHLLALKHFRAALSAFRCSWWVRANRIFKTEGLSAMVSARSTADDR